MPFIASYVEYDQPAIQFQAFTESQLETCISFKALKHSVALDNNSCPPFPVRIHNYVDPIPF